MSLQKSSCFALVIDAGGVTFAVAALAVLAPNAAAPRASASSAPLRACGFLIVISSA